MEEVQLLWLIGIPAGGARHSDAYQGAAPHVTDVRKVLIDHLTPEQLDLICGLGDQVRARRAELEQEP